MSTQILSDQCAWNYLWRVSNTPFVLTRYEDMLYKIRDGKDSNLSISDRRKIAEPKYNDLIKYDARLKTRGFRIVYNSADGDSKSYIYRDLFTGVVELVGQLGLERKPFYANTSADKVHTLVKLLNKAKKKAAKSDVSPNDISDLNQYIKFYKMLIKNGSGVIVL